MTTTDQHDRTPRRAGGTRWVLGLVAALLAVLSVAAAVVGLRPLTAEGPASAAPQDDVVRLGLLLPLTGDSARGGLLMREAAKMAVDDVNAAGGVDGRSVELVDLDDACDPQTAVVAANDLVEQDISVFVGGYCSSALLPTLSIFRDANIPMIVPAANSDDLLVPAYDSVFLLNGTGTQQAVAALDFMQGLGAQRVALVDDGTSYSANIAAVAAERLRAGQAGPLTLSSLMRVTQGAPEHSRTAQAVIDGGADVVYYTGYVAEAGRLIRDLRRSGYEGVTMVADGGVDAAMLEFAEGEAEGTYATMPPLAEHIPSAAQWSARFTQRAGEPPASFTVQQYDAVMLAVDALRRAGSEDGTAVAEAIATTEGVTMLAGGDGRFGPDGTLAEFRFGLLQVRDGRFDLVEK